MRREARVSVKMDRQGSQLRWVWWPQAITREPSRITMMAIVMRMIMICLIKMEIKSRTKIRTRSRSQWLKSSQIQATQHSKESSRTPHLSNQARATSKTRKKRTSLVR
jgi:hypothetical protein